MSIQRKPKSKTAAQDAFIQGAPDAQPTADTAAASSTYEKGIAKGHKRQISLTIAPELLRKVDEVAQRTGQARAAIINLAIFNALEGDIFQG
ncbi:MAG: CopG family transcriptional regulator [Burkholderiaceae bacterium]|nr:MAG: CopG family transcriptional regulator [Burkholderiaceae bacterium]